MLLHILGLVVDAVLEMEACLAGMFDRGVSLVLDIAGLMTPECMLRDSDRSSPIIFGTGVLKGLWHFRTTDLEIKLMRNLSWTSLA